MRADALGALFARASDAERDFPQRLLDDELRQGALEAVVVEAVARTSGLPAAKVRRGVMMSGNLGTAARAALIGGAAALDGFGVRLMQPVRPMLADAADDVDEALEELGEPLSNTRWMARAFRCTRPTATSGCIHGR